MVELFLEEALPALAKSLSFLALMLRLGSMLQHSRECSLGASSLTSTGAMRRWGSWLLKRSGGSTEKMGQRKIGCLLMDMIHSELKLGQFQSVQINIDFIH